MKKTLFLLSHVLASFLTAIALIFYPNERFGTSLILALLCTFNFAVSYYGTLYYSKLKDLETFDKKAPHEYAKKSLSLVDSQDLQELLNTVAGAGDKGRELVPILKAAILVPPLMLSYRADTSGTNLKERQGMTSYEMKSLLFQEFTDIPKDDIKNQLVMKIQHYLSQLSPSAKEAFLSRIFAYVDSKPPLSELLDWRQAIQSSLSGCTHAKN